MNEFLDYKKLKEGEPRPARKISRGNGLVRVSGVVTSVGKDRPMIHQLRFKDPGAAVSGELLELAVTAAIIQIQGFVRTDLKSVESAADDRLETALAIEFPLSVTGINSELGRRTIVRTGAKKAQIQSFSLEALEAELARRKAELASGEE